MKFRTVSAQLLDIEKGDNMGQKYLLCVFREKDPFAVKSHKQTFFIPQDSIPEWEGYIASNKLPERLMTYKVEEGLPAHYALNAAGERVGHLRTSMTILVRIDETGKILEDARSIALRIIDSLMEAVETDETPRIVDDLSKLPEDKPADTRPKFDIETGEPIIYAD